jgi:hypothetical protein
VLVAGSLVTGVGTFVLFLVFRRFGTETAGGAAHGGLIAALVGFVFLCCLALLVLSYSRW